MLEPRIKFQALTNVERSFTLFKGKVYIIQYTLLYGKLCLAFIYSLILNNLLTYQIINRKMLTNVLTILFKQSIVVTFVYKFMRLSLFHIFNSWFSKEYFYLWFF